MPRSHNHVNNRTFFSTHPITLEADELEQPHDPGGEERDEEVEGADTEPDAALEVALVLLRMVVPVALVEGVPPLAEGLEAGAHLEAGLDEGHESLVLAEGEAGLCEGGGPTVEFSPMLAK